MQPTEHPSSGASAAPHAASAPGRWFQRVGMRCAASILAGVLLALCFPRHNLTWLVWIAPLPLLLALLNEASLKRAYLWGAIAGAVFLTGSVYWIALVMKNYGRMSLPAALGVMAAFLLVDSSYWGFFGLVTAWTARRSPGLALAASPLLWVAMDVTQTYGYFGGFPWNLLGYGIQSSGLRQIATVTSVYGLSFLAFTTTALAAGLLLASSRRTRRAALALLALWICGLILANSLMQPPGPTEGREVAVLVQPNIPLNEAALGWAPAQNPEPLNHLVNLSLAKLREVSPQRTSATAGDAPLIVWSENSAPFYFDRDPVFRNTVQNLARQSGAYVIVGATTFVNGETTRPLNTAIVLDPSGNTILQYAKIHLVPFGEYVPALFDHLVGQITTEGGSFVPGSTYASAPARPGAIGVFICFEEVFPQLVRRVTPRGPGVLVNISDDAWYGDSSAAFQSMEMARLRAVESRRYLLRATDDGITDVIDPYGRVLGELPQHRQAAMAARFDYESGETFYTAHGDIFAWLCVAAAAALAAVRIGMGARQ
ncbi:MAG TPA: apolipoprotein N-acyltransferase [Terriglobia bacterium]|nr:apolipoprotein N-acyltransferase [Terriglobia bacterium]